MEDEKLHKAITVFIVIGVFTSTSGLGKLKICICMYVREKPSTVKTNTKFHTLLDVTVT